MDNVLPPFLFSPFYAFLPVHCLCRGISLSSFLLFSLEQLGWRGGGRGGSNNGLRALGAREGGETLPEMGVAPFLFFSFSFGLTLAALRLSLLNETPPPSDGVGRVSLGTLFSPRRPFGGWVSGSVGAFNFLHCRSSLSRCLLCPALCVPSRE